MAKAKMKPVERVLAALRREPVDRIPWIEGIVQNRIASAICGERVHVDWSVAPDGFPEEPGAELAEEQKKVNRVFGKDNINFCAFAPIFARKMTRADDGGPVLVGDGIIRTREDLDRLFRLPSPEDRSFVRNAREFVAHKGDYCACACVRLGIGATLLTMGIEGFSYAMAEDPGLIVQIHDAYADWTARVVPVLEDIGFDAIWAFDDIAFNSGPIFSPEIYARWILPKEKAVVATFSKPLITHSDGDMNRLLDHWLELGQAAIHPIQPDVMDIREVKRKYGARVAIVGNVSMDDLVHAEPAHIEQQVRDLLETLGPGGGYLLSSSNSITDDMKPENVRAMITALDLYGWTAREG